VGDTKEIEAMKEFFKDKSNFIELSNKLFIN
jgi:hypothetical protein